MSCVPGNLLGEEKKVLYSWGDILVGEAQNKHMWKYAIYHKAGCAKKKNKAQ